MTDYALPITGTGSSQAVSAEAHDAEVQRAIDEAVAVEEARALLAEDAVASAIAAEAAARISAVAAEQSARIAADNAEQVARIAGDASLSDAINAEAAARISEDGALLALATAGDAIRLVGGSGTAQAATYTVRAEQADLIPGIGSLIVFEWPADNTAADPVLTVGAISLTLRTPGGGALSAGDLRASVTHIARVHSATTARVLTLTRIGGVNGLQEALDGKAAVVHTHAASEISDSTAPGRAVLTAATAAAQRTALGLGTAATTAASDYATAAQGLLAASAVQPGDPVSDLAETASAKIMTAAERTKLAGIATGATANATDAALRDRATHTGVQAISTVADLQDALDAKASVVALDARIGEVDSTSQRVPVVESSGGVVPVWLDGVALDGMELGDRFRAAAADEVAIGVDPAGLRIPVIGASEQVALWFDPATGWRGPGIDVWLSALHEVAPSGQSVPVIGTSEQVALWFDPSLGWRGPGIDNRLTRAEAAQTLGLRQIPIAATAPIATDGRNLHRLKAKLAAIRAGQSEQLRIGITGDSWTDQIEIPGQLSQALQNAIGITSPGWLSVGPFPQLDGVTRTASAGWTLVDGSATSDFPYGAGPDGYCLWTAAADQTLTYAGVRATEISITRHKHGGTWRWRVNGGAWTAVTDDASGDHAVTTITGLTATNTLEIDTTGNTGVVALAGCYATRAGVSGAELSKWGNSGTSGFRLSEYLPYVADAAAIMRPDLLIVILGTNDYRTTNPAAPAAFEPALRDLIAAVRSSVSDCGVILVAPSITDAVPVTPLSDYRDAMYRIALDGGADFVSLYDAFPPYAQASALGLMAESLHLSVRGAQMAVDVIDRNLINL